ncbi:unnamed protein product [Orchesella dallaii]|uniref:Uncharacterized protein n=1 Tax=Orchesella dallaii TaxID=48710 RepID=A0ABP1RVR2_9HEXA
MKETMKAVVLEKFATVGLPDTSTGTLEESTSGRNWSILALSQKLIDEQKLLNGLHRLNSRSLDLVVIGNENKIALLNLQSFKLFPCHLATSMIRNSLAHHFSEDGNLVFGIQPSGDLFVLTDRLQTVKNIRKPSFIKLNGSSLPWYSRVTRTFSTMASFLAPSSDRVTPEDLSSQRVLISSWLASTQKFNGIFPYLTALPNGFAILCALSPQDCFIFLTTYETALRQRSIANFKGPNVPGEWHRILMDKSFIRRWLEEKEHLWFEGRLVSSIDIESRDYSEAISGAMLYAVLEHTQFHLVYGLILPSSEEDPHFRLSWEIIHYELDWALREDNEAINLGSRFVARLSSDCSKVALVINTHIGTYIHVEQLPSPFSSFKSGPVKLSRNNMAFCPHGNFDGTHFFKRECWVSDIQWLAEDGYFAVMTECGSLSIFHGSGSSMLIKIKLAGSGISTEDKKASFFLPVFYRQQISSEKRKGQPPYPVLKWVDSQQVLCCCSGLKIELFSLKRVFNLEQDEEEGEEEGGQKLVSSLELLSTSLNESLTFLFAQNQDGRKDSGLSQTSKESTDYMRNTYFSGSPFLENVTTTADKSEVESGSRGRRTAPVNYVSVEDDEQDIYGGRSTSGELSVQKDMISTVGKVVESCEEESSIQPVSRSDYQGGGSSVDGSWDKKRMMMVDSAHSTTDTAESAPDPDTNTSRSHILESDDDLPSPSPKGYLSLPQMDLEGRLPTSGKKRSQVYMADDELSDGPAAGGGGGGSNREHWQGSGFVLEPILHPPNIPPPPSSTATFETLTAATTADTYSPPFTCQSLGPTSAVTDGDEKEEEGDDTDVTVKQKLEVEVVEPELEVVQENKKSEVSTVETVVKSETGGEEEEEDESELDFSDGADAGITATASTVVDETAPSAPPPETGEEIEEEKMMLLGSNDNLENTTNKWEEIVELPVTAAPELLEEKKIAEKTPVEETETEGNGREKEKTETNEEKHVEEPPPLPSQSSSLTHSSQTQTPASTRDEHGTQTIRFTTSTSGCVSEEEHVDPVTAALSKKRCRPYCVITTPPPPSKKNSGSVSSRPSKLIGIQPKQLELNKAVDDQMAYKSILIPGEISEKLRNLTKKRKKKATSDKIHDEIKGEEKQNSNEVERDISLSKLSEKVCQQIVDEINSPGASVPLTESSSARPSTSQMIWEQAAHQFQQKVGLFVEQKRRRKSTTDVKQKSTSGENNANDPGAEGHTDGGGGGVKESRSMPTNAFPEDVHERLKSILKRGTQKKSKNGNNSLRWLRDAEPTVEQFRGRTLPYIATSSADLEIVEELKRCLQQVKLQQDQSKQGGSRELARFFSSWALDSEAVLPGLNLQEMMIQPTVFPLLVEQPLPSPQIQSVAAPLPLPDLNRNSPHPPQVKKEGVLTTTGPSKSQSQSLQMAKSQLNLGLPALATTSFIIAGAPSGIKRNKSNYHLINKKSIPKVGAPRATAPPPPVPPQSPKKKGYKPQGQRKPIYIAPSMRIPSFTIGPAPKPKGNLSRTNSKPQKNSVSKGKLARAPRKDLAPSIPISRRSSHRLFVKAQPGKTKIVKSPTLRTFPIVNVKPRVNTTTSAIVQSASKSNTKLIDNRREMILTEKRTIKKVVFVPTSPAGRTYRSNLKKLSLINKKIEGQKGKGGKGRSPTPPPRMITTDKKFQRTGSTTTLFRRGFGGEMRNSTLRIEPEAVEPVFVGGRSPKKGGGGVVTSGSGRSKAASSIGCLLQLSEADREKLARRVSFSDPIAIVRTVSPADLNENSNGDNHGQNVSLVIGPGKSSPRRETKSQFHIQH